MGIKWLAYLSLVPLSHVRLQQNRWDCCWIVAVLVLDVVIGICFDCSHAIFFVVSRISSLNASDYQKGFKRMPIHVPISFKYVSIYACQLMHFQFSFFFCRFVAFVVIIFKPIEFYECKDNVLESRLVLFHFISTKTKRNGKPLHWFHMQVHSL